MTKLNWVKLRTMQHLHDEHGGMGISAPLPTNRTYTPEAKARLEKHLAGISMYPQLLDMLIRIHAAEFGYGAWPEEGEITKLINEAGGMI